MFSINPLRFFRRTQTIVTEAYRGASKMGKGKKLKSSSVTADFEKFENMVFGNSFTVLDPAESDFDFLEQLSPRSQSSRLFTYP
ncbi:hypothetical protein ig2599ANME_0990 [groundwater metagenome]